MWNMVARRIMKRILPHSKNVGIPTGFQELSFIYCCYTTNGQIALTHKHTYERKHHRGLCIVWHLSLLRISMFCVYFPPQPPPNHPCQPHREWYAYCMDCGDFDAATMNAYGNTCRPMTPPPSLRPPHNLHAAHAKGRLCNSGLLASALVA